MASAIGICVPRGCTEEDMRSLDPKILLLTDRLGWENVIINYTMASNYTSVVLPAMIPDNMSNVLMIILSLFVLLGLAGTIVELTKIGDIPSLNYDVLNPAASFKSTSQYEAVLLQRKKPWAQLSVAFSLLHSARSMVA